MEQQPVRGYRFSDFRLDIARRRLGRGDVAVLPLSGRAFEVLAYLLENRHRLVPKRELLDAVWPRMYVEENNLTQAISALRRTLEDSRDAPRFILTVAGRGYQFVGDARPYSDDSPGAEPVAAGASRLPSSIAVLPFRPLVSGNGDEAIEVGVAELLINRLSAVPGTVVRPLSSVRRFVDADQDPIGAGRELAVAAVVEGHVQVRDAEVRLTARLLDVATGAALWSGSYTERRGDFFAVQDALATQLVNSLTDEIPLEARRRLVARNTSDTDAWQLYANGRYQLQRRDPGGLVRARAYFEAAAERDPGFALAITGLSEAWALAGTFCLVPVGPAFDEAHKAARRALEIEPQLPEALVALGHVMTQYDRDFAGGRSLYLKALALAPEAAWTCAFLALNAAQSVSTAKAIEYIERAQALEPAAMPFMALHGFFRYFARQFDLASRQLSGLVDSAPEAVMPRQFLARVLLAQGRAAEVIALLEGRNESAPGSYSNLARAHALTGNVAAARAEIARVEALGAEGFGVCFDLALIHLALGDRAAALAALEGAVDDGSQMIGYLNVEPALDPLRNEPRFRAVAQRIGFG
jgi:DNA-binding winged helix-turn-helix (wHTH) protein